MLFQIIKNIYDIAYLYNYKLSIRILILYFNPGSVQRTQIYR